jgi:hypothetical protein
MGARVGAVRRGLTCKLWSRERLVVHGDEVEHVELLGGALEVWDGR